MAKILFAWELGMGLGHIARIRDYCDQLKDHDLYVAAKDLRHAFPLFSHTNVTLLPAPFLQKPVSKPVVETLSYAHILHNCGFANAEILKGIVSAWRSLFDLIKPDIVIFDHCPSAILAALDYSFKKVTTGTGFTCPPIQEPLGVFFPDKMDHKALADIAQFEQATVHTINSVLREFTLEPISALSDIYSSVDETLISALSEYDHFSVRKDEIFLGLPPSLMRKAPVWPDVPGKRIFLYTHRFQELPLLLNSLQKCKQPVIVYSSSIESQLMQEYASESMVFETEPLDLNALAKTCELAITNANFNVSCQLFLQGVPILAIPLHREQQMFAHKLFRTGGCRMANPNDGGSIIENLQKIGNDEGYRQKAIALASASTSSKCESFSEKIEQIIEKI